MYVKENGISTSFVCVIIKYPQYKMVLTKLNELGYNFKKTERDTPNNIF